MKRLMIVLAALFVYSISAFAQMGTGQGGHMTDNGHDGSGMMGGGWGWWGMYSGWFFIIIIVILVIFGAAYMTKRK